jgi:hypothetical protein
MLRLAWVFFSAMVLASLPVSALSAYVLHDAGEHLNASFISLIGETIMFSLVVSGLFFLWIFSGPKPIRHPATPSNIRLVCCLAIATMILQYPFDLAARTWAHAMSDKLLAVYMLFSPVVCAAILLAYNVFKSRHA